MSTPEVVLMGVRIFECLWRACSVAVSSYSMSDAVFPDIFKTLKVFLIGFQVSLLLLFDLLPLSHFPRISLAHRLLTVPSQVYTMYYTMRYISPALDSPRLSFIIALISFLCILETVYMIKLDWSRIE